MSNGRILIVDDDPEIREIERRWLEEHGYEITIAVDGRQALERVNGQELVVLDLQMPKLDGFEVLTRLRQTSAIPIIVVSGRNEGADRIAALEMGADDYLVKPFLPRELVARVKALLRRSRLPSADSVQSGPVVVDSVARRVTIDGAEIELTPREYDLLKILAQSPGRTFTREELLDRVWGEEYVGDTRRVDIHISKLRSKLTREGRPAPLRSIWGVGYRFES